MKTKICERLGCEVPIFAFTHCRDVVVEVTRAGGFGVLGAVSFSPEQLEQELNWIDAHVDGRPYGVDVLMAMTYDKEAAQSDRPLGELLPAAQREFMNDFLASEGVAELSPERMQDIMAGLSAKERNHTPAGGQRLIEVALRHPQVKLIVNALGTPPREMIEDLHARGILVGALCGKPAHAVAHRDAGVDIVIAQGTEAGGHTGDISTLVLVPQVVDICTPEMAVLAAGGISRGRQILAARALGAQGVWCGTLWLGTRESELTPLEKQALFAARSEDAVRRKWMTGKMVRMLRSKTSEAWERPDAPPHLMPPLQTYLYHSTKARIEQAGRTDLVSIPAGQVAGLLHEEVSVRQVMQDMLTDYANALEELEQDAS